MPFVVKEDEALDPHDVGLFGPATVMPATQRFMHHHEQSRFLIHPPRLPRRSRDCKKLGVVEVRQRQRVLVIRLPREHCA